MCALGCQCKIEVWWIIYNLRALTHAIMPRAKKERATQDVDETNSVADDEPLEAAEIEDDRGEDDDVPQDGDDEESHTDEESDEDAELESAADEPPSHEAAEVETSSYERMTTIESEIAKGAVDNIIVIPDAERRTSQIMSISEYTEAISLRTEQIAADGLAGSMLDELPANATTAREIALAEMKARRCPLRLVRHVGRVIEADGSIKNYTEIWSPNVMTHPAFQ